MFDIKIEAGVKSRWIGETVLLTVFMEQLNIQENSLKMIERDSKSIIKSMMEKGKEVLEDSRMQRMKKTFRLMPDMDPSRYNPASEALIKRFITKGFFSISPLVDVNNLLSAQCRIPFGIYDSEKITEPELTYRIGVKDEKYTTISQSLKTAEGKLVLCDSVGVIGSPISDSGRACIASDSKSISIVGFLPINTTQKEAEEILSKVKETYIKYFRPEVIQGKLVCNVS